jgi:hypothetical protein
LLLGAHGSNNWDSASALANELNSPTNKTIPKARTRKAIDARSAATLEMIPNVGRSIAMTSALLGIETPAQLIGRDPQALYDALCKRTRSRRIPVCSIPSSPPCASWKERPARPWWHYTAERKKAFTVPAPGR